MYRRRIIGNAISFCPESAYINRPGKEALEVAEICAGDISVKCDATIGIGYWGPSIHPDKCTSSAISRIIITAYDKLGIKRDRILCCH